MTEFKKLQLKAGMTNEQVAEHLDIGVSTVKRYKSGERQAPTWVLSAMNYEVRARMCRKCGKPSTNKCSKTPSGGWGTMKCSVPLCANCKCDCDEVTTW